MQDLSGDKSEETLVEIPVIEGSSSRRLLNLESESMSSHSLENQNVEDVNDRATENTKKEGMRQRSGYLGKVLTLAKQNSDNSQDRNERRALTRTDRIRQREMEAIQGINEDFYDDYTSQSKNKSWKVRWFGNANGLIHPSSRFRTQWDVLLVIAIFVMCFAAPFKWAFEPPSSTGKQHVLHASAVRAIIFYVIELITDLLFILDIYINLRTGYFVSGGAIMDPVFIRKQYFQCQFKFDLLACVPFVFDIMYPLYSHPLSFRFVKLLQLAKLYSFFGRYQIVTEAIANYYGTLFSSILSLFCSLLVIVNWLSCIWFFTLTFQPGGIGNSWLSQLPDLQDSVEFWINAENDAGQISFDHRFKLYIASFYWASSAGDGFDATTTSERICAIAGQFLVVNGMGALIIASIMSAIDDFDLRGQKYNMYRQKIDSVNAFMNQHLLPRELQSSVRRYYHEVWTREKLDFTDVNLLEELPEYLRHPIMQHITRQMISMSEFFSEYLKGDSEQFDSYQEAVWADAIAGRLKPKFATPMEYIIKQGDTGTEMFIIKQGKVAVEVDGNVVAYQSSGSYFGDIAVVGPTVNCRLRTASVRAIMYCEMYTLEKDDLEHIWREHPNLKTIMERVALAKLRRSQSSIQDIKHQIKESKEFDDVSM